MEISTQNPKPTIKLKAPLQFAIICIFRKCINIFMHMLNAFQNLSVFSAHVITKMRENVTSENRRIRNLQNRSEHTPVLLPRRAEAMRQVHIPNTPVVRLYQPLAPYCGTLHENALSDPQCHSRINVSRVTAHLNSESASHAVPRPSNTARKQ